MKGTYEERFNVLTQMKQVTYDPKLADEQKKMKPLIDLIEGFGIGDKPADLDNGRSGHSVLGPALPSG